MMIRLDFNGGAKQAARAIRVSRKPGRDVAFVADAGPHLPFRDSSVDELFVGRTIAHRSDIAETLDEMWRVAKPGALIHLTLPHASSAIAVSRDPWPRPLLTLNTFNYYDQSSSDARRSNAPSRSSLNGTSERTAFTIERARLRVAGARADDTGLALARGPLTQFIEKLANGSRGSQYRFERWFANLFGGFEEFDIVLGVRKTIERRATPAASANGAAASNAGVYNR